jgi:alcohol dehydrogenase class IV
MIFDVLPESALAAGLGTLMKGAGKVTRLLPIPQPALLVGPGSSARLGQTVAAFGHAKLLIVTDRVIHQLGLLRPLTDALSAGGAAFTVFDEITPDAPIPLIERGIEAYLDAGCDALIAVGGGSAIDAAKAIALSVSNPRKSLRGLAGYYKGLHAPAPVYAVPTTAGTGSEVTVAAVVADPERESKLVIVDTRLVPRMAALDAALMTGLPRPVTAATGIDALTHAVEAFIGRWATPQTDGLALAATGLIFANLRTACTDGGNLVARENMSLASTWAGMAFTRANVGYVHAIAHQLGGRYHTPHGLANALMLPHVLRFSAPEVHDRLALLARRAGLGAEGDDDETLSAAFIDGVEALCRDIGLPTTLDALEADDIPELARAALREAHAGYPVPRYMNQAECELVIAKVLSPKAAPAQDAAAAKKAAKKAPKAASTAPATRSSAARTAAAKPAPAKKARRTPPAAPDA